MSKWIAILKAGKYPQGNVTTDDLKEIAKYYDPAFIQAPFIPEHRKYDKASGELINNMAALGWITSLKVEDDTLYILPENEENLKWIYDGKSFKYASAEIELVEINGKKVKYLAAVACTNFPASKIDPIKLNDKTSIIAYTQSISFTYSEDTSMDKDKLLKLCKILGMPETSTEKEVLAKLTELKDAVGADSQQFTQISEIIKLFSVSPTPAPAQQPAAGGQVGNSALEASITKLTETVTALATKFDKIDSGTLEAEIDKAITGPVKKLLPSQKDDMLKAFTGNVEGFKTFVSKLPVLQLTKEIIVPNNPDGKPLSYSQLINDNASYLKMQKDNPELLDSLRQAWLSDPTKK